MVRWTLHIRPDRWAEPEVDGVPTAEPEPPGGCALALEGGWGDCPVARDPLFREAALFWPSAPVPSVLKELATLVWLLDISWAPSYILFDADNEALWGSIAAVLDPLASVSSVLSCSDKGS